MDSTVLSFFFDDPMLRLQQGMIVLLVLVTLFFLFFALRDILLRTHSLPYQIACILLVAVLPILGFLIYLLVRPARTIKERELEALLHSLLAPDSTSEQSAVSSSSSASSASSPSS